MQLCGWQPLTKAPVVALKDWPSGDAQVLAWGCFRLTPAGCSCASRLTPASRRAKSARCGLPLRGHRRESVRSRSESHRSPADARAADRGKAGRLSETPILRGLPKVTVWVAESSGICEFGPIWTYNRRSFATPKRLKIIENTGRNAAFDRFATTENICP